MTNVYDSGRKPNKNRSKKNVKKSRYDESNEKQSFTNNWTRIHSVGITLQSILNCNSKPIINNNIGRK